jgi:formylglycine-generating enzyme required for sulfatase activity
MADRLALEQAREHTDALFAAVRPEALYDRPIPERHRIVFYLGHLEAFDWNLIGRHALDLPPFHAEFDRLFAFGIDPPPGQLPADTPADWPGLAEVERYNTRVRDKVDRALDNVPAELLHVAIEHRLMHAETFAYILHGLAYHQKSGTPDAAPEPAPPHAPSMVEIPAGNVRLGREPDEGFGWDNEFHAHVVDVPAFSIAETKVTNGDYLAFVNEGAEPPFFWTAHGARWLYRGMFAEIPLPLDWPVYCTWIQADAYARWRGMRLPTEAEYHRALCFAGPERDGNRAFRRWDPEPVTAGAGPARGPRQLCANGWEWTSTVFAPFPGFKPFPFYLNYSEPFFDGGHYVLKGASPRTAARFLRPSFRNWFRAGYPYTYSGFRLAAS